MALSSRYPQLLCILMRFLSKRASSSPFACARIMLNDVPTLAIFINSKPRFGLAGGSQGPLSGADARCSARRRGKTTRIVVGEARGGSLERSLDNRGDGSCASRVRNAERSDALDGVRHQFSRAGPDLGLRHALLSVVRGRAVLDRFGIRCGGRCGDGDAARGFPGFAGAAAVWRHRACCWRSAWLRWASARSSISRFPGATPC